MTIIRTVHLACLVWIMTLLFLPAFAFAQNTPSEGTPSESTRIRLSQPIGSVREVSDLAEYISIAYRYMIGLSFTAAIVMVIYGGFHYLMSSTIGQVQKGKKIVLDAVAGLALVLGAYGILSIVNPATLRLRFPTMERIRPNELKFGEQGHLVLAPEIRYTACALDMDSPESHCPTGQVCLRHSYVHRLDSDGEQTRLIDETQDRESRQGGSCTDGNTEGVRCRCAGEGCLLLGDINVIKDLLFADRAPNNSIRAEPQDRLAREFRNRYKTNNNFVGTKACQNGLTCMYYDGPRDEVGATLGRGWFCQRITQHPLTDVQVPRTAIQERFRTRQANTRCTTDAACGAGGVCIRIDPGPNQPDGECSQGGLAERCRCRSWGCAVQEGVNNRVRPCLQGFECKLYGTGAPTRDGLNADWFCGRTTPPSGTPAAGTTPPPTPPRAP